MISHSAFLARLAQPADTRIILLVVDGIGGLKTVDQPQTALELASTPHLDELAAKSALGRLLPVAHGVTPGSGPGHLSLFGYDPRTPEADIGRGVLEGLGLGIHLSPHDLAARGNFATAGADGNLTDRRAGRISSAECQRLCVLLQRAVGAFEEIDVEITAGEGHRFVLVLRANGLSAEVADTDPQEIGVPPLPPRATDPMTPQAEQTVEHLCRIIALLEASIQAEAQANRVLLRGFSKLPHLPQMGDLYKIRAAAFAGYPLYRGVAKACGMAVVPCGKKIEDLVPAVREDWNNFDFFFIHVKQTDMAGEDGDLEAKAEAIEAVDRILPDLLALQPDVIAITGDHSTPAPMLAHSWHPVPLLLNSKRCFVDSCRTFTEESAVVGHLGTIEAWKLMGLLLANAGRLAKFGA
ncbi:MAG: 2,3-bisphosphoglycerate-independent phosphoglycerate mutase [Thermoanaerobaculia bacterium]